ncbi:ABC transporter ATP-binding protein [Paenibacillus sacheonensis]|uniref:ATP-binding cassette domain-containing protein n=1 Tax=Paenibacillus sacheonensis TaxID=742054 RepID=A0A7X4YQ86_9BACL|nr:ABC transporter ATP-binding protein [Paenibacillus sacheonensis]MBM7566324.1 ATP-binding cassette subfamily B protein [Paenibacillus sacheonensis]NBC70528.1 ATP-binding cassette domain-containing protein [Paenibacillus sacheonensis]
MQEFRGLGLGAGSGGAPGGGGNRWRMRELAQNEHFDWAIFRRALRAFVPYWPYTIIVTVVILAASFGGVIPAWLTQRIIDEGIQKHRMSIIVEYTLTLILISIGTGLLGVLQTWLSNLIAQNVMADYRIALFRHLQRQTVGFFASRQAGDLVSRVTNDVTAIQSVVTTTLVGFVSNLLNIAATLFLMFSMDWRLAVLAVIVVPGFVIPTQRVGKSRQKLQGHIQNYLSKMTVQLSESLGVSGALLIRIFNRQGAEEKEFAESNHTLRDLQVKQALIGRWLFMWLNMFSSIGPALLWMYGGWLVLQNEIGLGVIVAFTALLSRLYGPLSQLAQLHVSILSSVALFRRIFSIMDEVPEVQDGKESIPDNSVEGRLRLEKVSFSYRSGSEKPSEPQAIRWALQDIELTIEPGETVALVGPSGAGKTTLLNLIPRFSDPASGHLYVDGMDTRSLTLHALRAQMGLVPQDPFFFHDTVASNLRLAKESATAEEMEAACRAAQIHDTINSLPEGYDTIVGERGYRLSGGERQRLAIARVLLQGPKIVLLDEATSALDTVIERKIQDALAVLLEGRTALVIAHRLSTILKADKIVVMANGRIAAIGTHAELVQRDPLYKELYETQFHIEGEMQQVEEKP